MDLKKLIKLDKAKYLLNKFREKKKLLWEIEIPQKKLDLKLDRIINFEGYDNVSKERRNEALNNNRKLAVESSRLYWDLLET